MYKHKNGITEKPYHNQDTQVHINEICNMMDDSKSAPVSIKIVIVLTSLFCMKAK